MDLSESDSSIMLYVYLALVKCSQALIPDHSVTIVLIRALLRLIKRKQFLPGQENKIYI